MVGGLNTFAVEVEAKVDPKRMWYALAKDSHNLLPKILPDYIRNIQYIGGCNFGKGSVREIIYGQVFLYKTTTETIIELDEHNYSVKVKVSESGVLEKLLHHHINAISIVQGSYKNSCYVRVCMEYDSLGNQKFHDTFKLAIIPMIKVVEKYLMSNNVYMNV